MNLINIFYLKQIQLYQAQYMKIYIYVKHQCLIGRETLSKFYI